MGSESDVDTFATAHAGGAFVLDVREPREYLDGHVPGALLVPLAQLLSRLSELPKGETVFVICASGNRSKTATSWLNDRGFEATSVAGGTSGWVSSGRTVVIGLEPDASVA
jgi:rhodanese-related sulfurtransferase